jgi:hypothetical protein
VWTESLVCISGGFPNRRLIESLRDRRQGAGHARLSRSGVFEAFFQTLAECSKTAHLIQFFDSTTARAHVSAAGAKATVLSVKCRFDFL